MDTTTLIVVAVGVAGLGLIWWLREHADPDPVEAKKAMQSAKLEKIRAALARRE